jgi:glutathione peroxidase
MYKILTVLLFTLTFTLGTLNAGESMQNFYDFDVQNIQGETVSLSKYKGDVVLVVNVASKCGYTPQYEGLETLYKTYHAQGFEILAFPCNQFKEQEPGTAKEIQNFCKVNYGVTFPLFAKIEVNGKNTAPLYVYLKAQAPGLLGSKNIKWNFTKFLIDKQGKVVKRYGSSTKPKEIASDIETLLK